MDRFNRILTDPEYLDHLARIEELENQRIFCGHNLAHFLDVARLSYILNLEYGYSYPKEILYTIGILHDIGRWQEYEDAIPHERASAALAEDLLLRHGYHSHEREMIGQAILNHRIMDGRNKLNKIVYLADKLSRNCRTCKAQASCKKYRKNFSHLILY